MAIVNSIFIDALIRSYPPEKLKRYQKCLIDTLAGGALQVAFEGNLTQFDSPEQIEAVVIKLEVALQRIEGGGQDDSVSNIIYADRGDYNYWR
ncbi:MAG: hypothetical protein JWO56_1361 [Acidobacteria bacterium]|nr:hypothetical protein [Acidobacteriota bacterium]